MFLYAITGQFFFFRIFVFVIYAVKFMTGAIFFFFSSSLGSQPNLWCSPFLTVQWQHVLLMARREVGRLM